MVEIGGERGRALRLVPLIPRGSSGEKGFATVPDAPSDKSQKSEVPAKAIIFGIAHGDASSTSLDVHTVVTGPGIVSAGETGPVIVRIRGDP